MTVELTLTQPVAAPAVDVWRELVDWPGQSRWMLATRVRATGESGVGCRLDAVTGVGPLGVHDRMVVTVWQPPRRAAVRHLGRVVRGTGVFGVDELPDGGARVLWSERLDLPLGRLGTAGWPLLRPFMAFGVRLSLRRLARLLERERAEGRPRS